jgi:large subunit ribosomal protein L29
MKASELRAKSAAELQEELLALRRAQLGLRVQLATQQQSNTSQLGKTKRDIARVKTVLKEKGVQQ